MSMIILEKWRRYKRRRGGSDYEALGISLWLERAMRPECNVNWLLASQKVAAETPRRLVVTQSPTATDPEMHTLPYLVAELREYVRLRMSLPPPKLSPLGGKVCVYLIPAGDTDSVKHVYAANI